MRRKKASVRLGILPWQRIVPVGLLAVIVIFALYTLNPSQADTARAAGNDDYAWSSNIGWISLTSGNEGAANASCDNSSAGHYGVCEDDSSGTLSGYAWSSSIGWISFNAADVSGCPIESIDKGSCTPRIDYSSTDSHGNHSVIGWARACGSFDSKSACSGSQSQAGGWTGWVHLAGTIYGLAQIANTCSLASYSYAWGGGSSTDIGWIHFAGTNYNASFIDPSGNNCGSNPTAPTATLIGTYTDSGGTHTSPPGALSLPSNGGSVTFTWSTTNASRCDADIASAANTASIPTGGVTTNATGASQTLTQPDTFTLTCYSASGVSATSQPVTVEVGGVCPPGGDCTGGGSVSLAASPASGWADSNNSSYIKNPGGDNDVAFTLTSSGVSSCSAITNNENSSQVTIGNTELNGNSVSLANKGTATNPGGANAYPVTFYANCYDNTGQLVVNNSCLDTNNQNHSACATINVSGTSSSGPTCIPSISAAQSKVKKGSSTTLDWTTTSACSGCVITDVPPASPSSFPYSIASGQSSGNPSTDPIDQTTTFTLSCNSGNASAQTTVGIQPSTIEI